jgi:hypothetical protein
MQHLDRYNSVITEKKDIPCKKCNRIDRITRIYTALHVSGLYDHLQRHDNKSDYDLHLL